MVKVLRAVLDVKEANEHPELRYQLRQVYPELQVLNLGAHSGDLLFQLPEKLVLMEIKRVPGDLLASITDKRLFQQAEGMRKETPWCFLLLSEDPEYDHEGHLLGVGPGGYGPLGEWNRDHIDGAMTAVQARGVMTRIAYKGFMESIRLILNWVERADRGSVTQEPVKLSPFDDKEQRVVNLLCWFEGIGVVQARTFIEWAGKGRRPLDYLRLATTWFGKDKPRGWTRHTIQSNREQLGILPNEQLGALTKPEWLEELDT